MECKNTHFINKFIDKDVDIFAAGEEWWVLLRLLQLSNGDDQQVSKDLFIKPKSEHCSIALPCPSQSHSFTPLVETWMMWPWRVKIHATSPKVTKLLLAVLYRILPNHTRGFVQISKLKFCQGCEAKVLSTLKHGIIKGFARICQSSYIYISCPLSNNTKLKLDLDLT